MRFKYKDKVRILNKEFVNFYEPDEGFILNYKWVKDAYIYEVLVKFADPLNKETIFRKFEFEDYELEKLI